ncbi:Bifunctional purine biosynthetic protein ade1 [Teratosphaeriaceae sp. CCFEE 6253]|nr:Bifunctional purine biosynthetic protein ade1 [Teratosphaeriaceae sp. CCFEE 6253]
MSNTTMAVTDIDETKVGLPRVASGKVREIFEIDAETLLFVATDRISAYDVVLDNGIPGKGDLLTQLSAHWFELIASKLPDLKIHLVSLALPSTIPASMHTLLDQRSMQVRRHPILPIESIVRGYITGSAWAEYRKSGTVNEVRMPEGLRESQKLEQAIWTPSTKAEAGMHDENISKERAAEILGAEVAGRVEKLSLQLYELVRLDLFPQLRR